MVNRILFLALAALLLMIEPVRADIVWTLPGNYTGHPLVTSYTFSSNGGYDLTAYGYTVYPATSPTSRTLTLTGTADLSSKKDGAGETGVGIAGTTDNEIGVNHAVALDLGSSYSNAYGNVTITVGSVQNSEGFAVFGGLLPSSKPSTGSPYELTNYLGQVTSDGSTNVYTFTVTPTEMATAHDVLYVSAIKGNVVIESINAASVPEPGTLSLLLTGLASAAGLGCYRRRRVA